MPDSEIPFINPTSASAGLIASETRMPPLSEFCYMASVLLETLGVKKKD